MRIVIPLLNLSLSGGLRIAIQYASGLAERGHNVILLLPDGSCQDYIKLPDKVLIKKVKIAYLLRPLGYLGIVFSVRNAVPACDVILAISWQSVYMVLTSRIDKSKIFHLIQHDDAVINKNRFFLIRWRNTLLYRHIYKLPLKKIVVSRWLQEIMESKYNQSSICIPNGVDSSFFEGASPVLWTPPKSAVFDILCLARSVDWKGFDDMITAMRKLVVNDPFLRLIIASREKIDIPSDLPVVFYRPQNDAELGSLYRTCNVFVFPSWIEGFGLPPLEAMANGAPVITTDCGGVNDFAVNGVNCIMVPPRCPDGLADAIKSIRLDRELAKQLSEKGMETSKIFTMNSAVSKLEKMFMNYLK